jgi:hypothetical protein
MSTFGDFDELDPCDTDPPDPEATARIFVALLHDLAPQGRVRDIDLLDPWEKALLVFAFAALLARLRREGGL